MTAVIEQLRNEGMEISEEDIRRLWPTRYEHINAHGKFLFNVDEEMNTPHNSESPSTFHRPNRNIAAIFRHMCSFFIMPLVESKRA